MFSIVKKLRLLKQINFINKGKAVSFMQQTRKAKEGKRFKQHIILDTSVKR